MKKKSLVIFLHSHIWDLSTWDAMEVEKYKKNSDVIVYELGNFLNKFMVQSFKNNVKSRLIVRPKNVHAWKEHFFNVLKKNDKKKILIINNISPNNFKSYLILKELSKLKINIVNYKNPGLPLIKKNKSFSEKIKQVIDLRYFFSAFKKKFFYFLFKNLKFHNYYYLLSGSAYYNFFNNKKKIHGSSWDFNKTFVKKKSLKLNKNYAVYVQGVLDSKDDNLILGPNAPSINKKKWLLDLNKFFSQIEKILDLKIIILAHPKSDKKISKYFNGRKVYFNKTQKLIYHSSFVLVEMWTTAISFVIRYRKPAMMIYSDEKISTSFCRDSFFGIAKLSGINFYNIKDEFSPDNKKNIFLVNKKKYKTFENHFLGTRKKTNYTILKNKFL